MQIGTSGWRTCIYSSRSDPQTGSAQQHAVQDVTKRAYTTPKAVKATAVSSFPYACQQLASVATPGTLWPEASRTALQQVNEQFGGRWLLVECQTFRQEHPLAGERARALLHVTLWAQEQQQEPSADLDAAPASTSAATDTSQAVSSLAAGRHQRQAARSRAAAKLNAVSVLTVMKTPTPRQEPAEHVTPIMFMSVYELSTDGWPTGERQVLQLLDLHSRTPSTWMHSCHIPSLQTLPSQTMIWHSATSLGCGSLA